MVRKIREVVKKTLLKVLIGGVLALDLVNFNGTPDVEGAALH